MEDNEPRIIKDIKGPKWSYITECKNCNNRERIESISMRYDWETFRVSIKSFLDKGFIYRECKVCINKYTKQELISFDHQNRK